MIADIAKPRPHVGENESQPMSITEFSRDNFGFAHVLQDRIVLPQWGQDDPRVEAQVDALGPDVASLGKMTESAKGGLERRESLAVRSARRLPNDGIAEIANSLVPDFSPKRMVGKPLDVLRTSVHVDTLDGFDDASVERATAIVK